MNFLKFTLIISLLLNLYSYCFENTSYKVIKVVDGDTLYIDFNKNNKAEKSERVRLNGIDCFETRLNNNLNWQMKKYNLSKEDALKLGYMGKIFAKKELLEKEVIVKYSADEKTDKYNRSLVSIYYDCDKSKCKMYDEEILKEGLAVIYQKSNLKKYLKKYEKINKIKAKLKKAQELELVVLNKNSKKYHTLNCKYGWMANWYELIEKPNEKYAPAKCCH